MFESRCVGRSSALLTAQPSIFKRSDVFYRVKKLQTPKSEVFVFFFVCFGLGFFFFREKEGGGGGGGGGMSVHLCINKYISVSKSSCL